MQGWRGTLLYVVAAGCVALGSACFQIGGTDDLDYRPGEVGAACSVGSDCKTGVCSEGSCQAVSCELGSTMACYTGPEATKDRGTCKGGVATCEPDGSGWGACIGEVLPDAEACETPEDEDCDGYTPPCLATWSTATGLPHSTVLAVDGNGNIAVGGYYFSGSDIGIGAMLPKVPDYSDGWVAKLDAQGNPIWAKVFGAGPGVMENFAHAVTQVGFDPEGNVLVVGHFEGTLQHGNDVLQSVGEIDVFAAKLDAQGNPLWTLQFGTPTPDIAVKPSSMALAPDGSLVLSVILGASEPWVYYPWSDVIKVSPSGKVTWQKHIPDVAVQVTCDAAGNVLVVGDCPASRSPDLGGGSLGNPNAGQYDNVFVIGKLDESGNHLWSRAIDTEFAQQDLRLTRGPSGEFVITGRTHGSIDFGGGLISTSAPSYIVKLDANGEYIFSRAFTPGGFNGPHLAAVTPSGDIFVAGTFNDGTTNLGGAPLSTDDVSIFTARFSAAGDHVWSRKYDYGKVSALVLSPSGNPLLLGGYVGAPDFGAGPLPQRPTPFGNGDPAGFLASLAP